MKTTLKGIEHEYLAEMKNTSRMLAVLPEDQKNWKPHPKSMDLGSLASHVVELQTWYGGAIFEDSFDLEKDYVPMKYESSSDLNKILEEGVKKNLVQLHSKEDAFWLQNFTFRKGDYIIVTLPRVAFIRSVLTNHFIHHRGQLSVYLRLLDVPVPGIYGPSADER